MRTEQPGRRLIMVSAVFALVCVGATWLGPASADSPFCEEVFGPADVAAVSGNGRLTVGTNASGRVSVCRWPSPSYHDQISYRTRSRELPAMGVPPWHGLMWGLRLSGETSWLIGPPWHTRQTYQHHESMVIETLATHPNLPLSVTQTLFVHPEHDLLVAHLTVRGSDKPPEVYWFANFTPCTRFIPELPLADWALDMSNDFAAFTPDSGRTIYHFRPEAPGPKDWERANELARKGAQSPSEWDKSGKGVWIACATPNRLAGFQCGSDGQSSSALDQASSARLEEASAAAGQCNSAITVVPEDKGGEYHATVWVAFGENRGSADALLALAADRGYSTLLQETDQYWRGWVARAARPATNDPEVIGLTTRCLLTLAAAMDRYTGAIVRAPIAQPPLGLDWPRDGAWMTLALDVAGLHDLAESHVRFYMDTVRKVPKPGMPAGSMPSACYANRVEAVPHVILELDAVAWTLWSCWRHSTFLDSKDRQTFLSGIWDSVQVATEFLANWSDERARLPGFSFDPGKLRDARDVPVLIHTYMGVTSALNMAAALGSGSAKSEWRKRQIELEAAVQFHCLDGGSGWHVPDPAPFWPANIIPLEDPGWDAVVDAHLDSLPGLRGHEAAQALCNLAMLSQGRPHARAKLQAQLRSALLNALAPGTEPSVGGPSRCVFPDALDAALCYIAAMKIAGGN